MPPNADIPEDEPEPIRRSARQGTFRQYAREQWPDERWRLHRWAYCRLTERVDRHISVLLEGLRDSGLDRNTLIIFTSDHGDHDGAHRLEHKGTFYEEAVHIPLIVKPPRAKSLGRVDGEHLVSNGLDLLPTVCDYAGVPLPVDLKGNSLRPLIESEEPGSWRTHIPIECSMGRMVATGRYKYIVYDRGDNREQLVDREADPGEMRNAIHDGKKGEIAESHRVLFSETFGEGADG